MVKHLLTMQETQVQSLGQEDPWRRKWQPTPVFLPGESHGWRNLVGYSPRGLQRVGQTEQLHFHFPNLKKINYGKEFSCSRPELGKVKTE